MFDFYALLVLAEEWEPGLSETAINSLHQAGLSRLRLGTDNWTAAFMNPQVVKLAKGAGYLVASYDSYDTGIPQGLNDSWLTAQLPSEITEKCHIIYRG
ncbi:glycoside hydrolase [Candidatus Pantoea bituminis]|uniref:glycoside hydrolase n=1 Tax=Candidatus Pantoea bituminis TaxID=2831036 RepID=UPI001C061396|nr:glycoside hydrolase [Pantoea bituminis]